MVRIEEEEKEEKGEQCLPGRKEEALEDRLQGRRLHTRGRRSSHKGKPLQLNWETSHAQETAACGGGGHSQERPPGEGCNKIESLMQGMLEAVYEGRVRYL